jgi:hypothetical protein
VTRVNGDQCGDQRKDDLKLESPALSYAGTFSKGHSNVNLHSHHIIRSAAVGEAPMMRAEREDLLKFARIRTKVAKPDGTKSLEAKPVMKETRPLPARKIEVFCSGVLALRHGARDPQLRASVPLLSLRCIVDRGVEGAPVKAYSLDEIWETLLVVYVATGQSTPKLDVAWYAWALRWLRWRLKLACRRRK